MAKKPRIKTSSLKAKGRLHQQAIKKKLMEHFPFLREGDIESRSSGAAGVDIMLSPTAKEIFPVSIEAKKTKKTPSRAELQQSQANAYPNTIASVVWAPHGLGPDKAMIMFDFDEFLVWYKKIREQNIGDIK